MPRKEKTKKDNKANKYNIIIVVPDTRTGEKKDSAAAALEIKQKRTLTYCTQS